MTTLAIPHRRDPLARGSLLALAIGVIALCLAPLNTPADTAAAEAPALVYLIATPTPAPTIAPVALQAAPTLAPPTEPPAPPPTPVVIVQQIEIPAEPQVVYVPAAADPAAPPVEQAPPLTESPPPPPPPTMEIKPAPPNVGVQMPGGAILVETATPGSGDPGFKESFRDPNPNATCQFVGCLHK